MSEAITVRPPAYRRLPKRAVVIAVAVLFVLVATAAVLLLSAAVQGSDTPAGPAVADTPSTVYVEQCDFRTTPPIC